MPKLRYWLQIVTLVIAGSLLSCGELGQVEQGIVLEYDAARGLVTLVSDSNPHGEPRYDALPPVVVRIPQDPSQMGPEPASGMLIDVDTSAGTLVVYDPAANTLRNVPFSLVEGSGGVYPDDGRVTGTRLPAINEAAGTVTFYSPRTLELVTIRVDPDYLSLPAECWRSGDEIRYYFKDPGQALRLMNVTKTGES